MRRQFNPILLAVIVLTVLVGVALAVHSIRQVDEKITVAKVETSDWLMYENKKYGFVLKYPSNWVLEDSPYYSEPGPEWDSVAFGNGSERVLVREYEVQGCSALKDCAEQASQLRASTMMPSRLTEILINGQIAYQQEVTDDSNGLIRYDVYMEVNGSIILLSVSSHGEADSHVKTILQELTREFIVR